MSYEHWGVEFRPERDDDARTAALWAMLATVVWALVIAGIVVLALWLFH